MKRHPGVCGPVVELNVGTDLCGPFTERPTGVIPAAVPSHSKRMVVGWLSKPPSSICIIWGFCLHLPSVLPLKAFALLPFASLLGSEENDNNEAWRPSTSSHTNIHTYNTGNTDGAANCRHTRSRSLWFSRHTHMHIYTRMLCDTNAGGHRLVAVGIYAT